MKANLTAVAAALIVAGFSLNASAANTITFTGSVTSDTCSITGGSGTNTAGGTFVVALDEVSNTDLAAAGSTAGDHTFSINVGAPTGTPGACSFTDGTLAKMSWNTSQASIDVAKNALKNTGSAGTDVGIQLSNATSGAILQLNNPNDAGNQGTAINAGAAELKYTARYVALNNVAASVNGTVNAQLEYVVVYN